MIVRMLLVRVGSDPIDVEMEEKLSELQRIVGGYVEAVAIAVGDRGFVVLCNEDGRRLNLPSNRWIAGLGAIVGDFLITKHGDEGSFASLTDEEVTALTSSLMLRRPVA